MRTTDGQRIIRFAERFGRITKGKEAGKPVVLRDWQKKLILDLAASNAMEGYIQMPRGNGKSFLGAILALYNLCADGEEGAEVFSVAGGSRDQAKLVFQEAARMVELSDLSKSLKVYQREIVHPKSGSRYRHLASDAKLQEGLAPHFVVFDEVHVLGSNDDLWNVMKLGMGKREFPMMLGLTTPGVRYGTDGNDSVAFTLYEYGKKIESGEAVDADFFFRAWEAPRDVDPADEKAWHEANPGLSDFLNLRQMRSDFSKTPLNEFKTKRLGMWVNAQAAWLPYGAWEGLERITEPSEGTQVVLGFDGSFNRDATALVGATVEAEPSLFVVKVWEKPQTETHDWKVPRLEVAQTVRDACQKWNVVEIAADVSKWVTELEEWEQEGLPVVTYPQSATRMIPASQRFFEAVVEGRMKHDGNPTLARHLNNAVIKPTGQIAKETKDSKRKIDAAVASIMAYDRAVSLGNIPKREFIAFTV